MNSVGFISNLFNMLRPFQILINCHSLIFCVSYLPGYFILYKILSKDWVFFLVILANFHFCKLNVIFHLVAHSSSKFRMPFQYTHLLLQVLNLTTKGCWWEVPLTNSNANWGYSMSCMKSTSARTFLS